MWRRHIGHKSLTLTESLHQACLSSMLDPIDALPLDSKDSILGHQVPLVARLTFAR